MGITSSDLNELVDSLRASGRELGATDADTAKLVDTAAEEIEALTSDLDKASDRVGQLYKELEKEGLMKDRLVGKSGMPQGSLQRTDDMVVFVQKLVMDIPRSTDKQGDSNEPSIPQG